MHPHYRPWGEQFFFHTGDRQAVIDVFGRFAGIQGSNIVSGDDFSPDCPAAFIHEHIAKFGLTDEKNLEQSASGHFDAGQLTDLFLRGVVQSLSLVDDDQHFFVGGERAQEESLEVSKKVVLAGELPVHFEFAGKEVAEIQWVHARVRDGHDDGGNIVQFRESVYRNRCGSKELSRWKV
jgi:hypothetical protein